MRRPCTGKSAARTLERTRARLKNLVKEGIIDTAEYRADVYAIDIELATLEHETEEADLAAVAARLEVRCDAPPGHTQYDMAHMCRCSLSRISSPHPLPVLLCRLDRPQRHVQALNLHSCCTAGVAAYSWMGSHRG